MRLTLFFSRCSRLLVLTWEKQIAFSACRLFVFLLSQKKKQQSDVLLFLYYTSSHVVLRYSHSERKVNRNETILFSQVVSISHARISFACQTRRRTFAFCVDSIAISLSHTAHSKRIDIWDSNVSNTFIPVGSETWKSTLDACQTPFTFSIQYVVTWIYQNSKTGQTTRNTITCIADCLLLSTFVNSEREHRERKKNSEASL